MNRMRECVLGALDYLVGKIPEYGGIIRAAIKQISEDERSIRELTEQNELIRAETILEFTTKIKRYYTTVQGSSYPALVAYHVDKVGKEMLEEGQENAD